MMMRHRHTITSRDHVPLARVSLFIESKSRMTNEWQRETRPIQLRRNSKEFSRRMEHRILRFLSPRRIRGNGRTFVEFSFHDSFPRSKWKVAGNLLGGESARMRVSGSVERLCRVTSHAGEDSSLPSKARGDDCSGR